MYYLASAAATRLADCTATQHHQSHSNRAPPCYFEGEPPPPPPSDRSQVRIQAIWRFLRCLIGKRCCKEAFSGRDIALPRRGSRGTNHPIAASLNTVSLTSRPDLCDSHFQYSLQTLAAPRWTDLVKEIPSHPPSLPSSRKRSHPRMRLPAHGYDRLASTTAKLTLRRHIARVFSLPPGSIKASRAFAFFEGKGGRGLRVSAYRDARETGRLGCGREGVGAFSSCSCLSATPLAPCTRVHSMVTPQLPPPRFRTASQIRELCWVTRKSNRETKRERRVGRDDLQPARSPASSCIRTQPSLASMAVCGSSTSIPVRTWVTGVGRTQRRLSRDSRFAAPPPLLFPSSTVPRYPTPSLLPSTSCEVPNGARPDGGGLRLLADDR